MKAPRPHLHGHWHQRFSDTILSNLPVAVSILLIVVPATVWWFADSARELIEGNSYRIESIDRYATPSNTYTQLIGSARKSPIGATGIAVVFSGASPCRRTHSPIPTPTDTGTLFDTTPPGLLATIRYTRRTGTHAITFAITP